MGVIFDSSILIALMGGDDAATAAVRAFEESDAHVLLPAPVAFEVLVGVFFYKSKREVARFRTFTRRFQELPVDEPIAHRAAEMQADLLRMGRPLGDIDMLIAASALTGGHTLVTKDKRFAIIAEIFGVDVHIL